MTAQELIEEVLGVQGHCPLVVTTCYWEERAPKLARMLKVAINQRNNYHQQLGCLETHGTEADDKELDKIAGEP